MNNDKEEFLWQVAKKRAGFKRSFLTYLIINVVLIGQWYFSGGSRDYFWPGWVLLGWGIGIAFQYARAYHGNHLFTTEYEFEKLKQEKKYNY